MMVCGFLIVDVMPENWATMCVAKKGGKVQCAEAKIIAPIPFPPNDIQ